MPHSSDLVEYIKRGLREGHSVEDLKKAMHMSGWDMTTIEDSLKAAMSSTLPSVPSPLRRGGREGVWQKMKHVLSKPDSFFEGVKAEQGYGDAFRYYLLVSVLPSLASALLASVMMLLATSMIFQTLGLSDYSGVSLSLIGLMSALVSFPIYYAIGIVSVFIGSFFVHFTARILGAKGGSHQTFKALVYGGLTPVLIGSFPVTVILMAAYLLPSEAAMLAILASSVFMAVFGIWSAYLQVKGVSKLHGMSLFRAFMAVIGIPLILTVVIAAASFLVLGAMLLNVGSLMP